MTKRELNAKYFETRAHAKKKGAGKGYKMTYTEVWREGVRPIDYLTELSSIDRTECGMLRCRIEHNDLTSDRWWDTPNYRNEHLREYRSKITRIRKEYGLTSSAVAEFMRV